MAAQNEYYVDPVGGNDTTGSGTSGAPWATVSKALTTITRDATNGDRINLKAGGPDTLSAALSISTTYGNPSFLIAPLTIQGYTSTAGDGGVGEIDGNATYAIINDSAVDGVILKDLYMHNCGSATVISMDRYCIITNCRISGTSGSGVVWATANGNGVFFSQLDNIGATGVNGGARTIGNYFANGTNDFTDAVNSSASTDIRFNIFNLDGASNGIKWSDQSLIVNNTIYASAGTGSGIYGANGLEAQIILNNYIEGFSGTGGKGLNMANAGATINILGYQYYYNNSTPESLDGDVHLTLTSPTTLGSSALTAPGSGDFSVGTSLKALGYPSAFYGGLTSTFIDVGAAQRQEPAGGGGMRLINGGLIG